MACIVLVQALNAADWAVILPIDVDIAYFLGEGTMYASWLVAALYVPFPLSLVFFERLTKLSYKWAYIGWAFMVVLGNMGYVVLLCTRPPGVFLLLIFARMVQGMGQCITFTNKQVLALVTSHDVRNVHTASLSCGNILGNAVGVMVCSSFVVVFGRGVTLWNDTPAYLTAGAFTIGTIALISGVLMGIGHPHQVDVVPDIYRVKKGGAKLSADIELFAGLSDTDTRKVRIMATNAIGFFRIMSRSAWQTVSIYLLMDTFHFSMFGSCSIFSAITLTAAVTQQWFGAVQHWWPDERWIRFSEIASMVSAIGMLQFPGLSNDAAMIIFVVASTILYSALSVNSNVCNVNATKFAIEGHPWFNQSCISQTQTILQNMLGKIAGPIYGMCLYHAFGQSGFALGIIAINVISTLISELTMPDGKEKNREVTQPLTGSDQTNYSEAPAATVSDSEAPAPPPAN